MAIRPADHVIFASSAAGGAPGAGYFGGGYTYPPGVPVDTVDKFAFSDDGRTTLGTGLSSARNDLGGMANSGTL